MAARPPRGAIIAWAALILGVIGFLWWQSDRRSEDIAAYSVVVDERTTAVADQPLRDCLDAADVHGLGLKEKGSWGRLRADPDTRRAHNAVRKTMVDVTERGTHRRVRFYSYQGRPLRASERAVLERCTTP